MALQKNQNNNQNTLKSQGKSQGKIQGKRQGKTQAKIQGNKKGKQSAKHNLREIIKVVQLFDADDANSHLSRGWVLLNAVANLKSTQTGQGSVIYVMGFPRSNIPVQPAGSYPDSKRRRSDCAKGHQAGRQAGHQSAHQSCRQSSYPSGQQQVGRINSQTTIPASKTRHPPEP